MPAQSAERQKKRWARRASQITLRRCVMCGNLGIISIVSRVVHFRRVMRIRALILPMVSDNIWNMKTNADSEIIINLLEQYVLISCRLIYMFWSTFNKACSDWCTLRTLHIHNLLNLHRIHLLFMNSHASRVYVDRRTGYFTNYSNSTPKWHNSMPLTSLSSFASSAP